MAQKMDERKRAEIKLALDSGMTYADAAKLYRVSPATISKIKQEGYGSEMQMTNEEICSSYRTAKDRKAQVKILAELNATSESEIAKILLADPTTGFAATIGAGKPAGKPAPEAAKPMPEARKVPEKVPKPPRETAPKAEKLPETRSRAEICFDALFYALRSAMESGADIMSMSCTVGGMTVTANVERRK